MEILKLTHKHARKRLIPLFFLLSMIWFLTTPALAVQQTAVWNGGSGNWNSAANWDIAVVPNNNGDTYLVKIDGGKTGTNSTVSVNTQVTVDGITIDAGDTLNQLNAYDVNVADGYTTNNGTWNMNSSNSTTYLRFYGTSSLSGAGQLNMSNSAYNYLWTDGSMLTQSSGHTIQGAGQILQNTGGMINQGTMIANHPTVMTIDPNSLGFTNNGILRAEGAGGIKLQNGTFSNTASDIQILNGSQLAVQSATLNNASLSIQLQGDAPMTINASTINGGTISADSGTISFTGGTSTLDDVAVTGAVNQASNATVEIQTGITHNGTWNMNGSPLRFNGGLTLFGTGEITMSNSANNYIRTDNTVLTIPSTRTIRGAGRILWNTGGMINQGTIIATQPTAITIYPNNLGFTNQGILRAEGAGGITLYYGTFSNTASDIDVLDGSQLTLQNSTLNNSGLSIGLQGDAPLTIYNSTINGGTISADSGAISFTGGTSTLDDVVVTGTVTQASNATVEIESGITHNGTWNMNGSSLRFNGGLTLLGTGELNMSNSAANYVRTDNTVLTIPASRTVRGAGQLLYNTGGMVNQGTIIANHPTVLTIDPNNLEFTNNGVLRAEGAGGIKLQNGTFSNTASDIDVLDGSQLTLYSATLDNTGLSVDLQGDAALTIYNSTINGGSGASISADSGTISFTGGTSTLNDVAVTGAVTQAANATVEIESGITHNGTWSMNAASLRFNGGLTLLGTGEINMSNSASNYIRTDNTVLTIPSSRTIRGAGRLLYNTGGMINQGTIIANQPTAMAIYPNNLGFTNQGTLRAEGAGGINLQNGTFSNTASDIEVLDGSQLTLQSATLNNTGLSIELQGNAALTINASTVNGGNIVADLGEITISGATTLNDVVVTGTVNQANAANIDINNGLTHNGTWNMNSSSYYTYLDFNGGLTLLGTGEIVMSNSAYNYIRTDNTILTIPSTRTIRGAGQLLNNTGGMVNQGTIIADQSTALIIRPNNLGFTNEGTLQATGDGGITINNSAYFENAGTVEIDSGSVVTANNDYTQSSGTTLLDDGTLSPSGEVALEGGTLQGTGTVNGDVTNSGGSVEPGTSPGILTIDGDYVQQASAGLAIDIGGVTKGVNFDSLAVTGSASLNGSLNVSFIDSFVPSAGSSFEIMTCGSRSGTFSSVNVVNLPTELTYDLVYTSTAVRLTISRWQTVFDFTSDREEWTSGSVPIAFSVPEFSWSPDYLNIISTTNTNCFGFWQSPQLPTNSNYLYRALFTISTDVTDQALVPWIRVRANSLNLQQYDVLSIESAGNGGASPTPTGTDYELYFVPPANDTATLFAFDLLNFNPFDEEVAELSLDGVTVDRFALDALPTATVLQDYTFELSTDGWTTGGAPIVFSPPQYSYSGGALELRSTTNTNTFGYWGNNPGDITIEADRLYRGRFEVRTDVTNPALVPELRLRFNTWNLQASHTFGISSAGSGANSPGTTNTTYGRLYFLPPESCVGQGLLVSFDILNFDPGDTRTASLILDQATIETLEPPTLP